VLHGYRKASLWDVTICFGCKLTRRVCGVDIAMRLQFHVDTYTIDMPSYPSGSVVDLACRRTRACSQRSLRKEDSLPGAEAVTDSQHIYPGSPRLAVPSSDPIQSPPAATAMYWLLLESSSCLQAREPPLPYRVDGAREAEAAGLRARTRRSSGGEASSVVAKVTPSTENISRTANKTYVAMHCTIWTAERPWRAGGGVTSQSSQSEPDTTI
ncbi:hypothetical protein EJB05_01883, partial [Eragrostis curvula]